MPKKQKREPTISVTAVVTEEERERISQAATRVDRSRSYWVRLACQEKLAREGG